MKTSKKEVTREDWFKETVCFLQDLKQEFKGKKSGNVKELNKKLEELLANYTKVEEPHELFYYYEDNWNERSEDSFVFHDIATI